MINQLEFTVNKNGFIIYFIINKVISTPHHNILICIFPIPLIDMQQWNLFEVLHIYIIIICSEDYDFDMI